MSDYIKREDAIRQIVKTSAQNELDIPAIGTVIYILSEMDSADVVEVGKWCDMREYILEMQADENGHNEFFRIIKLPVIFSNDELRSGYERRIMNHDNAHCLDYTSECPTTCYRARLTQELKDNPSIVRFVSWMSFEGTDECMKEKNHERSKAK